MECIGVRELRQNASRYLRRVAAGEDFQIDTAPVDFGVEATAMLAAMREDES